jgi:hypothetical protein
MLNIEVNAEFTSAFSTQHSASPLLVGGEGFEPPTAGV